ncbi:Ig-like domain-containing protein [candidate division KSB1 bacterium]|nr:Ig-like domain-containing protein [candidate division KSB1 bacterium]
MRNFIIAICILVSMAAAQDFSGYKFYINPGHGGNNPANDRYIPETGFWESEGNLTKGLYFRDLLLQRNAQVIMSRVTNYESDDRALSSIAAEANANNVDFFHSIHSNATGTTSKANYTLMLFRGYDNQPVFPAAKTMSQIMYAQITAANRTVPTTNGVRGDWSFYPHWGDKVGLGVLRTLAMPGVLSEGSFHDYIPESFRLTNLAYRCHEAASFLRSFVDFYNKGPLPYGTVAGIVRDLTRDVNYTYLPTLPNDKKQPINGITARLEPGGRIYQGDNNNNGFFFFDSVYTGTYQLIVAAEGYGADSAQVQVTEDKPYLIDFFLTSNRAPKVLSYVPANPQDSVRISNPITIYFNTAMNTEKTEKAFSITPSAEGSFTWQDYDQTMSFKADNHLDPLTTYTVTLDTTAVNRFDVPIDSVLTFSFTTDHIGRFMIDSSYPSQEQNTDISTTVQIVVTFNYPLSFASLSGNLYVEDSAGNRSPIIRARASEEDGKGKLKFEFKNNLNNDTDYYLHLDGNIRSIYGVTMIETVRIGFHTEKEYVYLDHPLDAFDAISHWQLGAQSIGIDSNLTKISSATDRVVSKKSAAKLSYAFINETGAVDLSLIQPRSLDDLSADAKLGVWIFGDLSQNTVAFCFKTVSDSIINVEIDTVDWTGWKLKYIELNALNPTISLFSGFILRHSEDGLLSGEIYFDDLSAGALTGIEQDFYSRPEGMALYQNYPNPFNPTTTITYSVGPGVQHVELSIFNLLGERLRLLINESQSSGEHHAVWDGLTDKGARVASGVYLYRLTVGSQSICKRMVLMK